MVRRFLYDQLYPDSTIPSEDVLEDSYLEVEEKIHVYNSAVATFRAPSDLSNINGMRREHIRATSSWRKAAARYDCVLVNSHPDLDSARGFEVGRVFLFFFLSSTATKSTPALLSNGFRLLAQSLMGTQECGW